MHRFRCINTRRKKDNATKKAQKKLDIFSLGAENSPKKESTEGKTPNRESKIMNKMRQKADSIGICIFWMSYRFSRPKRANGLT